MHEQQLINAVAHTMKPKVQNKTAKSAYRLCSTDRVFFSPSFLSFVYILYSLSYNFETKWNCVFHDCRVFSIFVSNKRLLLDARANE